MASPRVTGGVVGCGGAEEDHPSNPGDPCSSFTTCGSGDLRTTPNTPSGSGRLLGWLRISVHVKVGTSREDRRRSRPDLKREGRVWPMRHGSPMAA